MLAGRGFNISYFHQPTRIDYLIGWRYLINADFRQQTHRRWASQPMVMTIAELIGGTALAIFLPIAAAAISYALWISWFHG